MFKFVGFVCVLFGAFYLGTNWNQLEGDAKVKNAIDEASARIQHCANYED